LATTTEQAQHEFYWVLGAYKSGLELTRGLASGPNLDALDRRIEAVQLLLEWIARELSSLILRLRQQFKRRHHQAL
jgi:hypothetical protein